MAPFSSLLTRRIDPPSTSFSRSCCWASQLRQTGAVSAPSTSAGGQCPCRKDELVSRGRLIRRAKIMFQTRSGRARWNDAIFCFCFTLRTGNNSDFRLRRWISASGPDGPPSRGSMSHNSLSPVKSAVKTNSLPPGPENSTTVGWLRDTSSGQISHSAVHGRSLRSMMGCYRTHRQYVLQASGCVRKHPTSLGYKTGVAEMR